MCVGGRKLVQDGKSPAIQSRNLVTAYLQQLLDFIGLHPTLAIAAAFLVSAGEALPIIGLFSPSTVVLVGIGGLVGLGKVSFWPVFIATILGASLGDAISYWAAAGLHRRQSPESDEAP